MYALTQMFSFTYFSSSSVSTSSLSISPTKPLPLQLFLISITTLLLSGCFDWKTQLDAEVHYKMTRDHLQAVGLVVVQNNKILHQQSYGHSNRENLVRMNNATLVRTGSISKVLTTTAIMQLHESGKLHIDMPLITYLPEFFIQTRPDFHSDVSHITVRDLLTHTSGIPSDFFHDNYQELLPSLEEYAAQFATETLAQNPGDYWSYSNAAMTILGRLVEVVSQQSFDDYMQTHILSPLEMTASGFNFQDISPEQMATPYFYDTATQTRVPLHHLAIAESPAGSFYSNLEDMALFMQAVLMDIADAEDAPQILSSATYEEMLTVQNLSNPYDQLMGVTMGLGWFVNQLPYGKVISHGGDIGGFHNQLLVFPEQNIAVYATTNTENGTATIREIAFRAAQLALQFERDIDPLTQQEDTGPDIHPVPWTSTQLTDFTGHYSNHNDESMLTILHDNTNLFFEDDGETILLQQMSDQSVWMINADTLELFVESPMYFHQVENRLFFSFDGGLWAQYEEATIPTTWLNRLGHYHFEQHLYDAFTMEVYDTVTVSLDLKVEDGLLYLKVDGNEEDRIALVPYDDDRAYIPGLGRGTGETVWFDEQGRLHFSGSVLDPVRADSDVAEDMNIQLVNSDLDWQDVAEEHVNEWEHVSNDVQADNSTRLFQQRKWQTNQPRVLSLQEFL